MRKIILLLAMMLTMVGCTAQPTPSMGNGSQSKNSTLSGNEIEVFKGSLSLAFGGTTIIAKDGANITFVPNPPQSIQ